MKLLAERIDAMRSLPKNWDSYNADPPDEATLTSAQAFLSRFCSMLALDEPQVVPSRAGGVDALWILDGYELEMGFERDGTGFLVDYVFQSDDRTDMVEGKFRYEPTSLTYPATLKALASHFAATAGRVAA